MIINFVKFKVHCIKEFSLEVKEACQVLIKPEYRQLFLEEIKEGNYCYVIGDTFYSTRSSKIIEGRYNSIVLTAAYHYKIPVLKHLLKYNDNK